MPFHRILLSACIAAGTIGTAGVAHAASSTFDGRWQIAIAAKGKNCPTQYSVPLHVADGQVSYRGVFAASASGSIGPKGSVRVELSYKDDVVRATGLLGEALGNGSWTSPTRDCSGTWTARRTL